MKKILLDIMKSNCYVILGMLIPISLAFLYGVYVANYHAIIPLQLGYLITTLIFVLIMSKKIKNVFTK